MQGEKEDRLSGDSLSSGNVYSSQKDLYRIPFGEDGIEGGEEYSLAPDRKPEISESGDEVLVTAVITNYSGIFGLDWEEADWLKLCYRFQKVRYQGVEHYRLLEIAPAE